MSEHLREQMLASATDAVNALCTWAYDQPLANFDAREEHVLHVGRELLATWLGQLASAAGPADYGLPEVRRPFVECGTAAAQAAHPE